MGYSNSLINFRLISEGLGIYVGIPIMCGDAHLIHIFILTTQQTTNNAIILPSFHQNNKPKSPPFKLMQSIDRPVL